MKYLELKGKHEQEINKFPMHFAFSNEQFAEVLRKLDVKEDEVKDKLLKIDGGGFIRKTDSDAFNDLFKRHRIELEIA